MKKWVFIIASVFLLIGAAGCQKSSSQADLLNTPIVSEEVSPQITEHSNDSSTTPATTAGVRYDDSLIEEIYSEEGSYTDEVGNTYQYSYHIPALIADTLDAQTINNEIRQDMGGIVQREMDGMKDGLSLGYLSVSWESYWHGSRVFLVMQSESDFSFTDYKVFSYDFAEGKRVTNEMLLESLGVTQQEFLDGMKKAAERVYTDLYQGISEEERGNMGYQERLAWTLSDENLNMDLMIYLDKDGILSVITPIGSLAGADWYYHIVYPFAEG